MDYVLLFIALTSFGAATVNGALGYGYSSLTVPLSLIMVTSRVLNPALVIVEVGVNLVNLFLGRGAIRRVWPRVKPLVLGLVPGVAIGALLLAQLSPGWVKLVVYGVMLPLILVQAAGVRWPIRRERAVAVPYGAGVGLLYSLTTISGPPLVLFFNNQGLEKADFKVALAITRTAESLLTLVAYTFLGLFTAESTALVWWLAPGILLGVPLGHWLIRRVSTEPFRRVCMSFDAWVVAFGLSRTIEQLGLLPAELAYQILVATALVDGWMLYRFFSGRAAQRSNVAEGAGTAMPDPTGA